MRLLLLLLLCGSVLRAQSAPVRGLDAALDALFQKCNLMVAISGTQWRPGLCLAAGQLEVDRTVSLELTLLAGTTYTFIGTGQPAVTDLDLHLRDGRGRVLIRDTEPDNTPIVSFTPDSTGSYTVQLHLVAGPEDESFVALGLLQRGGLPLVESEYREVAYQFGGAAGALLDRETPTAFLAGDNHWCVYGFLLGQGQGATLTDLWLPAPHVLIAATGGRNFRNLDLYLATSALEIVAEDREPDPYPLIDFRPPLSAAYELRVEVERSKASGLVLLALFGR